MYREFFVQYSEVLKRHILVLKFICPECRAHNRIIDIKLIDLEEQTFFCFNCKKGYSFDKMRLVPFLTLL
ncbi:unnamed protein product [marine sediment metagenome]|uniref:Uncharacterized protein n=1 Tax=marine sediment metagenome TaxID=412755 RepID=X1TY42_9ZZZZ